MEQIIKVDVNNNAIGKIEKLDAHLSPILHRAFSVFLVCGDYMLLQKRATNKYHSGGLWANACCSHPRANVCFMKSVYDRLSFELGIKEKIEISEVDNFIYLTKFNDNLYEYELDHILIAEYNKKTKINFNKNEISEIKWVKIKNIEKDLLKNPLNYSSWFIISLPKVIKYLKDKKNSCN